MNLENPLTPYGFPADAWELLSPDLTEKRRLKMIEVASKRSHHVRLLLQDIHDNHNLSACIRSAEALGILNIDQTNLYQKFKRPSIVSRGSYHWLKIHQYRSIPEHVAELRKKGYKIAAGYPNAQMTLDDIPIEEPIAILFGNEHRGVHEDWNDEIDYRFTIPMTGMVESLNISVSAALSMYTLSQKAKRILPPEVYYISEQDREYLLSDWICGQLRRYKTLIDQKRKSKI